MGRGSLEEVRFNAHSMACNKRALGRITLTPQFEELWLNGGDKLLKSMVLSGDLDGLKNLLYNNRGYTLNELKILAQGLGIKNYSRLSREELEKELGYV